MSMAPADLDPIPAHQVEKVRKRKRTFYGRHRGRALRPGRKALFESLLPRLTIALPEPGGLDPAALFSPGAPLRDVWLEIGFGGGEHLAAQACAHPDTGFIGCEPFSGGLASMLSKIQDKGMANIRLYPDDARELIQALPDGCLGRVFVLFPDPWPKKRHHKRRIICTATLDLLAKVMKGGAELRLASDDADYVRWMLDHTLRHPAFEWLARRPSDWRERSADWPATRYEAKALSQGRRGVFLKFRRKPR